MPCRSCKENVKTVLTNVSQDTWLTQEEVRNICAPCYENMIKNSISKIRKSALEKIWSTGNMKFYEVIYKGKQGSKLNFGQFTLEPHEPLYLEKQELPVSIADTRNLPDVVLNIVELDSKPTPQEIKILTAKSKGAKGVMWIGAAPRRVNEYGTFIKNVPNFDLSPDVVEKLRALSSSFKVIE